MYDEKPPVVEFDGHFIHTIEVGGRPAWVAREIADALGYGPRLASLIADEWSEDFLLDQDFALVVGDELAAVMRQGEVIPTSPHGLLVLFESGLHLALAKANTPMARRLRRCLVEEVLPFGEAVADEPLDTGARRVDFEDRRLRSRTLREAADDLRGLVDERSWAACRIRACEIALGARVSELYRAVEHDWVDLGKLCRDLRLPATGIVDIAQQLGLLARPTHARPRPVRSVGGWTLTWRFSPEAVAVLEAWLAEQGAPTPPMKAA
ncbi:MAG: hypothetical protein ABMB14_06815 [Myxococcota bacterium]